MCGLWQGVMAAQLIGSVTQAFGAYQMGQSQSAEAKYRAQIAANNAVIADQNAEAALDKGRAESAEERRRTAQLIGLQKAQLAAAGFEVSAGSSIDILGDTAALGELDVLRIQADAENTARNYRLQAQGFMAEHGLGRLAAKNARQAGRIGAFSTLLTGGARAGSFALK